MYLQIDDSMDVYATAETELAYWQSMEKNSRTSVKEITLVRFMDALALMYPLDWQCGENSESFKIADMYCGQVTEIYARYAGCYFMFRDYCTLEHSEIIRRIKEVSETEEKNK